MKGRRSDDGEKEVLNLFICWINPKIIKFITSVVFRVGDNKSPIDMFLFLLIVSEFFTLNLPQPAKDKISVGLYSYFSHIDVAIVDFRTKGDWERDWGTEKDSQHPADKDNGSDKFVLIMNPYEIGNGSIEEGEIQIQ